VVHGSGLVAWHGLTAPHSLGVGDWWHVEPGVAHWHGATAASSFAHLAVTAGGSTTWLHEVSDAEHAAPPAD
jgi:quercetin dioxygenase-like cupin family protein